MSAFILNETLDILNTVALISALHWALHVRWGLRGSREHVELSSPETPKAGQVL